MNVLSVFECICVFLSVFEGICVLLGGSVCTYKHSNTLTKPQKHSLYVNVMSVYECILVYVSVNTYIHLHS